MNLLVFSCILSCLSYASCQSACSSHKSCGDCIGHALETCVWCSQENVSSRCQPKNNILHNKTWCDQKHVHDPPSKMEIVKNDNFGPTVQFRPQQIKIKARPGAVIDFEMSYKSAIDFPLDVYFLMDYSFTMKKHKAELENQALNIFNGLKKLTRNVTLGVGSFVDKPALPYADVENTCEGTKTTDCFKHYSYAFKNHLSLTQNMTQFESVIKNSTFGSNYDDAEAGLDALMQAMKCENQIGWREKSRRIIVLATDSTYHSAGDGKMIGAIKPNDMQCHLENDEYDRRIAKTHDYPSVSQINKVAVDGQFIIIFAALLKERDVYEALAKQIKGAKYAELKPESNILEIIKKAYEDLVKNVEMYSTRSSDSIQLKIDQDCKAVPTVHCQSSPAQLTVTIPATIKSSDCPNPGASEHTIIIKPLGLEDKLNITFEVDCRCECEINSSNVRSKECNHLGTIQCGACKCDTGRGGDSCELNCTNEEHTKDIRKCIPVDGNKECNNRGICGCGKCDCRTGFSGEYCQYDDTSCPHLNELICAGNGKCKFDQCECNAHWTGKNCGCPDHSRQCIGPFSAKVCSGRGTCECGACNCTTIGNTEERYMGAFCDSCDECASERCEELKDYAYCNYLNPQDFCNDKFNRTPKINDIDVHLVNKTEYNSTLWSMATKCRTEIDDGKFLLFKYQPVTGTQNLQLIIQNEVELPPKANIWVAIGSAVAGILIIGLLTAILWKVLIDMYDKKEYEKFCNEAKAQGYDVSENPLYEPPTQHFNNPAF